MRASARTSAVTVMTRVTPRANLAHVFQNSKSLFEGLMRFPTDISGTLKSMMKSPEQRLQGDHKAKSFIGELASSKRRMLFLERTGTRF